MRRTTSSWAALAASRAARRACLLITVFAMDHTLSPTNPPAPQRKPKIFPTEPITGHRTRALTADPNGT
ncbi:hypothetical protein Mkiyose1665_50710 [Mycobacterium kiyosense]|nr:hypothetical protein MKCMC460_60880 [Mycobacterium sp. 20KCMC460]GLB92991.1 hypothetical protein SRL2020130_58080 [Mycobacterium kiyosense]GLC04408.1 hypothetical protein SRL2020400_49990 [Mycobacterium kiyosense]GLC11170.1 hypothetical protein SRL2020411_58160 [Mycobacterium kiyosense]GLC17122.1 hypothetical protein SRL2020448_57250 [Mycobacterium kiyosense]